jgi:hypothetical protein
MLTFAPIDKPAPTLALGSASDDGRPTLALAPIDRPALIFALGTARDEGMPTLILTPTDKPALTLALGSARDEGSPRLALALRDRPALMLALGSTTGDGRLRLALTLALSNASDDGRPTATLTPPPTNGCALEEERIGGRGGRASPFPSPVVIPTKAVAVRICRTTRPMMSGDMVVA